MNIKGELEKVNIKQQFWPFGQAELLGDYIITKCDDRHWGQRVKSEWPR